MLFRGRSSLRDIGRVRPWSPDVEC